MDVFYEILKNLEKLDLIIHIDKKLNKIDMRSVRLYRILEDEDNIVVSQTRPPISRDMIGQEVEASFVVKIEEKVPDRFFFLTKIKNITLFPLTRFRLVDAIFLKPIEKKIYKGSLRMYPRFICDKDFPLYITIIPGDEKFKVIDISEGGLCFSCKKDMLNSIRFNPHKRLNIKISFSDNVEVYAIAEIIRRFEKDDIPDMYLVGIKFLDFPNAEKDKFHKMIGKIKEGK